MPSRWPIVRSHCCRVKRVAAVGTVLKMAMSGRLRHATRTGSFEGSSAIIPWTTIAGAAPPRTSKRYSFQSLAREDIC